MASSRPHITDAHVARRIDQFRPTLYNIGRPGPAGGTHAPPSQSGSADYILPHSTSITPCSQRHWRWCDMCQGMVYGDDVANSSCPTGGTHSPADQSGSFDYILPISVALV